MNALLLAALLLSPSQPPPGCVELPPPGSVFVPAPNAAPKAAPKVPRTKETWTPAAKPQTKASAGPERLPPPAPARMPYADEACGCTGCPQCPCSTGKHCGSQNCLCLLSRPAGSRQAAPPPCPGCVEEVNPEGVLTKNFGVENRQLKPGAKSRYRVDGKEVSRDEAMGMFASLPASVEGGKQLPDEAGKAFLVVIGDPSATAAVAADVESHPALARWKSKLLVRRYAPDAPAVAGRGFVTTGRPSIYLLAPDGKVLARNLDDGYAGPEALAASLDAAGARPYDPARDPNLAPPAGGGGAPRGIASIPEWAWVAGALALVMVFGQQSATKKDDKP